MDYQIGLFLKGLIIIFLANLNGLYCEIERDLILTPKLALHINGKILYYKPTTSIIDQNTTSSHVPWEQTLKHVTFLTLHNNLEENKDLTNFNDYKIFMNSSYIPDFGSYIPQFGDIITLARGRLEKIGNKNEYYFIEGQCDNKNCDVNNILAYWQVQKIRHRDIDRKYRYEIKFSVNPRVTNNLNNETNGKREININNGNSRFPRQSQTLKSFILKDVDYPKSFSYLDEHIASRRYDENRNIYLERLSAFNEVFTQPRYFDDRNLGEVDYHRPNNNNNIPDLNIGEYVLPNRKNFVQQHDLLPRISIYNNHNNLPTTYRPNYHIKFTKTFPNPNPHPYYKLNQESSNVRIPEYIHNHPISPLLPVSFNDDIEKKVPITTHLHHHYYLKNDQKENPELYKNYDQEIPKTESVYHQHQDTINLIQQPITTLSAPVEIINTPPSSISNQIAIPPHQQHQSHQQAQPNDHYFYNNNRGTNPILPSPPLFYMHTIPISSQLPLYLYPNTNQQRDETSRIPFRESFRIQNQLQYSEPDPLYENNREYNENYRNINYLQSETTKKYENIANTEINTDNSDKKENLQEINSEKYTKPDSINAQLPPPEDDEDLTVPYVENGSSATESSSESSTQLFVQKQIQQPNRPTLTPLSTFTTTIASIFQPNRIHPTLTNHTELGSEIYPKIVVTDKPQNKKNVIKISTLQPKFNTVPNFIPSTNVNTESSALKYLKATTTFKSKDVIIPPTATVKPKIILNDKSIITTTKKIYNRSTTERPVLKWKPKRAKITKELKPILSTKSSKFEFERVPVNVTERVFTVTPSKINDISTKKSVSQSISIKVGKEDKERPFTPKVKIPNVEVYEADIIKLNTTDKGIKFFKAFSSRDEREKTKENNIEEAELTQSIVEHVRSL